MPLGTVVLLCDSEAMAAAYYNNLFSTDSCWQQFQSDATQLSQTAVVDSHLPQVTCNKNWAQLLMCTNQKDALCYVNTHATQYTV